MGGGPLRRLDVDRDAGQHAVLAAVVEMEVRVRSGHDIVELDSGGPEQLGQGADRRPVGRLDFGIADADPGVEHHDAVGMDDREGHHDPWSPGEGAAIGVHEVGDMEGFDPDRGAGAASSDGRPTASSDGTKGPWDGIRPRC